MKSACGFVLCSCTGTEVPLLPLQDPWFSYTFPTAFAFIILILHLDSRCLLSLPCNHVSWCSPFIVPPFHVHYDSLLPDTLISFLLLASPMSLAYFCWAFWLGKRQYFLGSFCSSTYGDRSTRNSNKDWRSKAYLKE